MQCRNGVFAICDTETEYAFRFMEFLSHRKNIMFEIRVFTSAETLLVFAAEHPIEILLISERSMCDEVACMEVGKLIILTESTRAVGYPDCLNVYKYQSSDLVVREIMESYGNEAQLAQASVLQSRAMEVVGVFSPVPYLQKLLFSTALGLELSRKKKALYLNLESFSGFEAFTGKTHERNLSDLIYLFRRSDRGFAHKLNGMIYSIGSLDYLPPVRTPNDFWEITGEEWIRFFESLSVNSRYEVLILDIGETIPDVMMVLAYCSKIYAPVSDDMLAGAKMQEFEELLAASDHGLISEKMQIISPPAVDCSLNGIGVLEGLPWTELGRFAEQLCNE